MIVGCRRRASAIDHPFSFISRSQLARIAAMAFRQDGDKSHEWKRWLKQHRQTLICTGIPDSILRDERYWLVFLESGGWDAESGFDVDDLTQDQARELDAFLVAQYGADLSGGCIAALAQRISG